MSGLTWLDWAFVAVLAVTGIAGLVRGLVREALGLAVWVAALLAARWLAAPLADRLDGLIDSPDGRLVLAFVLVVLGVILAGGVIIRVIHAAVEWVGMGLFNRVAGAAFGLAKGGAILVVATLVIGLTPLEQLQAWQRAALRPACVQLKDWAIGRLAAWEGQLPVSPASLGDLPPAPSADAESRDAIATP
ncbi:CvpA family protein [Halomonas koreensis]|uniref:CvpA family protein n=1 Tax=Halomonas koreensis TaxID=245385 RepID=A0ABU1G3I3_9GAMM|nr:CvpA family protein [Halomonas koreensis]MDR5867004.1 CvpA family protein [Halomonas koreensis]